MAVRMVHNEHGTTYAVGSEVQWNESHGWRVEEKRPKEVKVATEEVAEEAPQKRRGRPPKVK